MTFAAARRLMRFHWPVLMLELATVCWGMGFSWAKNVGEAIDHAAGRSNDAAIGPMTGLAVRFSIAAVVWLICVPGSRRGWGWPAVAGVSAVGGMLSLGLILQHLGLAATDEGTTAFLTNLAVIFVPAWVLAVTWRTPPRAQLAALPIALVGMALLCGVGRPGPARGAWFGVACAAAFAAEILLLDRFGRGASAQRMTLGIFVVIAVMCGGVSVVTPGFADIRWRMLVSHAFLSDLVPLIGLTTVLAFGLMTRYQPKVDPTRAVLIYLAEPVYAALYAWLHNGRGMSGPAIIGACLILLANAVAEWKWRRVSSRPTLDQGVA